MQHSALELNVAVNKTIQQPDLKLSGYTQQIFPDIQ